MELEYTSVNSLYPFAFRCGGCNFSVQTFWDLHRHLLYHKEGGSYFYDNYRQIGIPKHNYTCTDAQTDYNVENVSVASQTEEVTNLQDAETQTDNDADQNVKSIQAETNETEIKLGENAEAANERDSRNNFERYNGKVEAADNSLGQTFCDIEFSVDEGKQELDELEANHREVKEEVSYSSDELTEPYYPGTKKEEMSDVEVDTFVKMSDDETDTDNQNKVCGQKNHKYERNRVSKGSQSNESQNLSSLTGKKKRKKLSKYLKDTKHKKSKVKKKIKQLDHDEIMDDISFLYEKPAAQDKTPRKKLSRRSEDVKYYSCLVCPQKFVCRKSWSNHIEGKHHDIYPTRCEKCSLVFSSPDEPMTHDCETAMKFNHVCNRCPRTHIYKWKENLRQHITEKHNDELPYRCSVCQKLMISELELNSHMAEHDPTLLNCPVCKKSLSSYVKLEAHVLLHQRSHVCERCGRCFDKKETFKHHSWACKGKFACLLCNKTFCTNNRLKGHMLIHSGERPYICEQCGQSFRSKEGLKSHITFIHTGEKNYKCSYCEKAFTNTTSLKRHERVHLKIRPFSCDYCSKECSTRWNLKAHMRQHDGKKPYVCNYCGYAFAHNVARKNHEIKCALSGNAELVGNVKAWPTQETGQMESV